MKKKIEKTAPYAPEVYWNDSYSGKLGLQLGSTKFGKPRMTLGGELLYVTGVNCYNLFVQCHEADRMGTAMMERTVKVLEEEQVPIVRFSCSPFYASQMHYYTEQKEQFLSNLKKLADLCDQRHILLIPSVFWNKECFPEYCGEEIKAWGNTSSKTYKLMIDYTKDIVNTLKDHKCLAAWEFGNEFNLGADIDIAGYAEFPAAAVETACKGFAGDRRLARPAGPPDTQRTQCHAQRTVEPGAQQVLGNRLIQAICRDHRSDDAKADERNVGTCLR